MKRTLTLFLLFFVLNILRAQQWSTPINISNQGGAETNSQSICIDQKGYLHCVWAHKLSDNFWKLYIAHSFDDGLSWTQPEDMLQNDSLWPYEPKIVADSKDNLHLIYTDNCGNPTLMNIRYSMYDGTTWSDPIMISDQYNYSYQGDLVVDQSDRLYCFWLNPLNNYSIMYRYFDNGTWSDIKIPYNEPTFLKECDVVCDSSNNLHFIGRWADEQGHHGKDVYFKYSKLTDEWSEISFITPETNMIGEDITVDTSNLPHVVWGQVKFDPLHDSTMYRHFDGSNWFAPELITEDPRNQQIIIDKFNQPNIVDSEKVGSDSSILVRYLNYSGNWVGDIIDTSECFQIISNMIQHENKIYLAYFKCLDGQPDVFFCKSDMILTGLQNEYSLFKLNMFPNPFEERLTIMFSQPKDDFVSLNLYTMDGKLILSMVNKVLPPGNYSVVFQTKDFSDASHFPSSILIRLKIGEIILSRIVIKITEGRF